MCQGNFDTTFWELGPFSTVVWVKFEVEAGSGIFNHWGRLLRPFWGSSRQTGSFPPPIRHLFLRLKIRIPGVVGVYQNVVSRIDYGRREVSQPSVSRSPSPNRACVFRYALGSPETIA